MKMNEFDDKRYDDMLHLPRPASGNHPPMPIADRAAQFSPFAALTGYDAAIRETARLTDEKVELDEQSRMLLDEKLSQIAEHLSKRIPVTVTYFVQDEKKQGGSYKEKCGIVRRIDTHARAIVFEDRMQIAIDDVLDIQSACLLMD